jgi:hypothetical protein
MTTAGDEDQAQYTIRPDEGTKFRTGAVKVSLRSLGSLASTAYFFAGIFSLLSIACCILDLD